MKNKITNVCASLVMTCLSSQVFASGFQLLEQNVTNLGLAYSGTAALAEDASTGYYNAAGLTRLGESGLVLSVVGIQGDFDFTASSATASVGAPVPTTITPVPGSNKDDPGTANLVPTFHISKRLDPKWVVSFNATTPFGLNTEYEQTGIARYIATNSHLRTVNLSPSIAYQIVRCLSVGFGADAMYARANLEARSGSGNQATDGFLKSHSDGWGYGWHVGLLWEPRETTRVGLHYRSSISMATEGNTERLIPYGTALTPEGLYNVFTVRAKVNLPDTATASLYHAFTEQLAVTADVAWTHWDRFGTLDLTFEPSSPNLNSPVSLLSDLSSPQHYENSWRYALGLIYTHNQHWSFKFGTAYDQTPTQDAFRTARVPDEDRIWAAIGVAYSVNEALRFDVGYAHLFFRDVTINEVAPLNSVTRSPVSLATLAGEYKPSANIVGIQMRYDFV